MPRLAILQDRHRIQGSIVPSVPRNQAHHPGRALAQLAALTPPPRACGSQCCPEIFPTAPGSRWVLVAGEAVLPVSQLLSASLAPLLYWRLSKLLLSEAG